ncbi:nucleoporin protein Ndc1-Nup [Fimicolochytrium jonesii]|uniref:nucleoporin protein Ndc1-Nup n=1 Tax=Fimicolochytrium jonesii TaxID=1396493 RepID=UPI0022FE643F|nr:nucleoporin protein Ndc1-Nup [Fimicolochytrium jonesii]KAI8817356.1 nucleoporin protein Ndc1-Nup [Fimicolochytrium jonesii]
MVSQGSNPYAKALEPAISRRVSRLAWLPFVTIHILTIIWSLSLGDFLGFGFITKIFNPTTWLASFLSFLPVAAILVARASRLQVQRRVASSRLLEAVSFLDRHVIVSVGLHALSALSLGISYALLNDRQLETSLLLYPQGHLLPPQLNDNNVFLVGFCIFAGSAYALVRRWTERDQLSFPSLQTGLQRRLKMEVATGFQLAILSSARIALEYAVLYWLGGSTAYNSVSAVVQVFTPDGLARYDSYRPKAFNPRRLVHTFLSAFLMTSCWELSHRWFEIAFTAPIEDDADVPIGTLVTGLALPNDVYQKCLAYRHLKRITSIDRIRRAQIYTEGVDSERSAWDCVSAECLATIDRLSQAIENEQRKATAMKSKAQAAKTDSQHKAASAILLKPKAPKTDLFGKFTDTAKRLLYPPDSPSRGKSGDDQTEPEIPSEIKTTGWTTDPQRDEVPLLLRRRGNGANAAPAARRSGPIEAAGSKAKVVVEHPKMYKSPGQQTLELMRTVVERWAVGRWLVAETVTRQSKNLFKDAQIQIWAIQSISALVTSAATNPEEDKFGRVSQDLRNIIQTLLRCQFALEDRLRQPPITLDTDPTLAREVLANQVIVREAYILLQVVQNSLYRIVRSWYEQLGTSGHIVLEPAYAEKFQRYLDFRE